jgi:CRP/FNR family cyclic AMP-dependent transcriptional regulator
MSADEYDILRKVPLFSDLGARTLRKIAKIADEVTVPAGKAVFQQGEVGYEFVFILAGTAKVEIDGEVVNRLFADDFLGEIALIDKKPRTASVTAEIDMRMLVVGSRHFDHLPEITPGLWKASCTGPVQVCSG